MQPATACAKAGVRACSLGGVDLVAESRERLRGALVVVGLAQHQHGAARGRRQVLPRLRTRSTGVRIGEIRQSTGLKLDQSS